MMIEEGAIMNNNKNYFPTNLRYLRKVHRVTQVELAKRLDKATSLINMWENEKRDATLDDVRKVAEMFKVSLSDIICVDLSLNYADYVQTEKETELINSFRMLTSDQQQAVLTMVNSMVRL